MCERLPYINHLLAIEKYKIMAPEEESSNGCKSMQELPNMASQYCLKWNNHKLNISNVFERLRSNSQFCDLTLTSADQKFVKCHRLLLCAGSG